jgi:hypothetical protein
MESKGEKVALTWFLHNSCTSNVELVIISSVCRRWREVASLVVASEAVALTANVELTTTSSESSLEGGGGADVASSAGPSFSRCIRTLLITDMARELVARQRHRRHERDKTDASEEEGGAQSDRLHPPNNTEGNFCLAWFAPSGMQVVSVSVKDDTQDDDLFKTKTTASATQQRRNGRGKTTKKGRNVNCCPEWRGYRHATEVLIPFGYSEDFIMVSATASDSDDEMISYT